MAASIVRGFERARFLDELKERHRFERRVRRAKKAAQAELQLERTAAA